MRRQDYQVVSHFQQSSKNVKIYNGLYYHGGCRAIPNRLGDYDGYLNYHRRISHWIDVFGEGNVNVRVFDSNFLKYGDVVCDFLSVFGIDVMPVESLNSNESTGFIKTKLGHLMNQVDVCEQTRDVIMSNVSDGYSKMLPSRHDARIFYERYIESNTRLNLILNVSEFESIFDDDFSKYPLLSNENWEEGNANHAIIDIIRSFDEYIKDVNLDCERRLDRRGFNFLSSVLNFIKK